MRQLLARVAGEIAHLNVSRVHHRLRGEHAAQQRLLRHFQREDGNHLAALHRAVLRNVDGPRRLAHAWARGDDDQLGVLQPAGHAVEVLVVRLQARDFAALLVQVVDRAEGVAHDLRDARKAAGDAALGHFHQRGLGRVQHLERLFALVGGAGNRSPCRCPSTAAAATCP